MLYAIRLEPYLAVLSGRWSSTQLQWFRCGVKSVKKLHYFMWLWRVLWRASGVADCPSDVPVAVLLPPGPMLPLGCAMGAMPYLAALLT